MSLYGSLDKTRHLNEFLEPLETQGSGVLTSAQRQALALVSLGITATTAQLAAVAGVTPGTAAASKAVVLDSSKNVTGVGTVTQDGLLAVSPSVGIGYGTGAGGAVVQATSKATAVVLNAVTGTITLNNAALAAATIVSFVFTNSSLGVTDQIVLSHESAGTTGAYSINGRVTGAGAGAIDIRNNTAGSLSEAIVLRFSVLNSVNA